MDMTVRRGLVYNSFTCLKVQLVEFVGEVLGLMSGLMVFIVALRTRTTVATVTTLATITALRTVATLTTIGTLTTLATLTGRTLLITLGFLNQHAV